MNHLKKITTLTLLFAIICGSVFISTTNEAEAQSFGSQDMLSVPVNDKQNNLKESGFSAFGVTIPGGLDGLAFAAANVVIARITDSIVSWINTGFQGSPAFIRDPEGWFRETADIASGALIEQLGAAEFLCTPFAPLRLSIISNYNRRFSTDYRCKLSTVINNVENYTKYTSGDFSGQGGWNSWFDISQNRSNNPYGVYLGAQIEMDKRISNAIGLESNKLSWGGGFLSIQKCKTPDPTLQHGCKEYYPIETPGSVVQAQLNQTLGSEQSRINVADEINEILSALANQLVKTVFTQGLANVGTGGAIDPNTSNSDFEVTCSVSSQQQVFLDPATGISQPVTWRSNVTGGVGPATYRWTVTGNPTPLTPPLVLTNANLTPVTYSSAGQKNMTVSVTKDGGQGLVTKFANCRLNVLPDPPLEVTSCSVNPTVVQIGRQTPVWTLNATGGVRSQTASSSANQMGFCNFNWWVNTSEYNVSAPLIGDATGSSCSIAPIPRGLPGGEYWQIVGSSNTNVTVVSGTQSAGPLQCGPLLITP